MYYGRGAGMMPTAVAVVSDVIEVSRNLLSGASGGSSSRGDSARGKRRIRDRGELSSRYYLRFGVVDKPGVLAQIAGILGEHEISISEVVQEGQKEPVPVVVTTHVAREHNVQAALARINQLPTVVMPTRLIRIFE
jgi:homoserine dehydrogenase